MAWGKAVVRVAKGFGALVVLAVAMLAVAPQPASAITVELAKKCRELAAKALPKEGASDRRANIKAQQKYYEDCVAKNGKLD